MLYVIADAIRSHTAMNKLVKDGKAIVSEFSQLKGAVAQAFAGRDSKAVQQAMQVSQEMEAYSQIGAF